MAGRAYTKGGLIDVSRAEGRSWIRDEGKGQFGEKSSGYLAKMAHGGVGGGGGGGGGGCGCGGGLGGEVFGLVWGFGFGGVGGFGFFPRSMNLRAR